MGMIALGGRRLVSWSDCVYGITATQQRLGEGTSSQKKKGRALGGNTLRRTTTVEA